MEQPAARKVRETRKAGLIWDRIHASNKDRLTGRVTPQATTTKRSAITFEMMFRWHKLVDDSLRRMRAENVDDGTDVNFEDVIEHFMWNLDEECLMGNAHGTQKVICEKGRRKHEKKTQDSRCSITLLRLGNAAGYQGATILLLKGQRKKQEFSDAFLERHGMTRGSTIIMTESAFMTDEAWAKCMPIIIKSIRAEPVVAQHKNWRVACTMDGFISHHNKIGPMQLAADAKIDLLARVQREAAEVKQAEKKARAAATKQKKKAALVLAIQKQRMLKEDQAPQAMKKLAEGKALLKKDYQALAELWFPLEPAVPGKLRFKSQGMKVSGEGGMKEIFNKYMATPAGQQRMASLSTQENVAAAVLDTAAAANAPNVETGAGIDEAFSSSLVGEHRGREKRAREGSGAQDKVVGKKPKTKTSVTTASSRRSSRRPIASRKVLDERERKAEAAKNSAAAKARKRKRNTSSTDTSHKLNKRGARDPRVHD